MPIRVVCTTCHSASEVADEAAGAQATCPFCSSTLDVPALADNQGASSAELTSQLDGIPAQKLRPRQKQTLEWGRIDPRTCIQIAIELYRAHPRLLLSTHCLFLGATFGVPILLQAVASEGQELLAGILQFAAMAFLLLLNIGVSMLGLHVARGQKVDASILFSGTDRLLRVLAFNLMFGVIVAIGCVGFIVPGIYFASRFWSGTWFIIDQDCSPFEAFGLAGQYSEGNRLPSMMLGLVSVCLAAFGVVLYGVGLILVYPLITLIWAIAYLMLTRQPIQRPIIAAPDAPLPA